MLISKILNFKNSIVNPLGEYLTDLVYSTFRFPNNTASGSLAIVNEYEKMRPDVLCDRIYGDDSKWDAMLKYNGVSNPFSVDQGDVMFTLPFNSLEEVYTKPRNISERGTKVEEPINGLEDINAGKIKDSNRLKNLSNSKGQLPPNINRPGDKNVKIKDGRVIFGEDVTNVNKENCPVPISRSRLKKALLKDKLFI